MALARSNLIAQQAEFSRVLLQTQDVSIPGKVAVQARAKFDPVAAAGRHTHADEEIGCVLEGQLELRVDEQPPTIIKSGESFFVSEGLIHDVIHIGASKTKVLAFCRIMDNSSVYPNIQKLCTLLNLRQRIGFFIWFCKEKFRHYLMRR